MSLMPLWVRERLYFPVPIFLFYLGVLKKIEESCAMNAGRKQNFPPLYNVGQVPTFDQIPNIPSQIPVEEQQQHPFSMSPTQILRASRYRCQSLGNFISISYLVILWPFYFICFLSVFLWLPIYLRLSL